MSTGSRADGGAELAVGQVRRHTMLDSEAVYRVVELAPETVHVEVVRAPGLSPGQRFRFEREAVAQMELLDG